MRGLFNGLLAVCFILAALFVASWIYFMPGRDLRGVWQSETGAKVLRLSPLTARTYSAAGPSCMADMVFPAHLKLVELLEGVRIEAQSRELLIHSDGSLEPLRFHRLANLPPNCATSSTESTPRETFEAFWQVMNDHYAFFDLHGVTWAERRDLAPAADVTVTDAALFALLSEALADLDDGHLWIDAGEAGTFSPSVPPDWQAETETAAGETRQALADIAEAAAGVALTPVEGAPVAYGLRSDGVGYISIRGMDVARGSYGKPLGTAMAEALLPATEALAGARAIIVDVRYNPGGSDTVAFGVASHFTDVPVNVLTKATRHGSDETAPYTATLLPYDDAPLAQPVIVLTSELTGSAAEVFTLAMRVLPQVTVMGENTAGGLSDVMEVVLPNGWTMGLSNQRYRTMSGALYEGVGIPPDEAIATDGAALARGEDPVLEAAIVRALDL